MAIAGGEVLPHERDVGLLVAGLELDQGLPATGQAEQLDVPQPQVLTTLLDPVLVAVLRQQLALVPIDRRLHDLGIGTGQGQARQLLEPGDVDDQLGTGEEGHGVAAEHDRLGPPRGLAGEVGGLVELGGSLVQGVLGPDRVDDLLAVEAVTGRQRQDLHQDRGMAAGPARGRDGLAVDADREATEQLHLDPGHRPIVAGHARREVTMSSRR